jgi:hypothetical protein
VLRAGGGGGGVVDRGREPGCHWGVGGFRGGDLTGGPRDGLLGCREAALQGENSRRQYRRSEVTVTGCCLRLVLLAKLELLTMMYRPTGETD